MTIQGGEGGLKLINAGQGDGETTRPKKKEWAGAWLAQVMNSIFHNNACEVKFSKQLC